MKNKSCQTGMTFIEIMIALLMGSILLGGVLQVFLGSKQTFRMQQALSRLQENGRFALDFLVKDIRMAGFLGCNSLITSIDIKLPPSFNRAFNNGVLSGNENITRSWNSDACGNNKECIRGTDSITFYSANSCGGLLSKNASSKLYLNSNNTCRILAKDIVLISNCSNANIFRPTQVPSIDIINYSNKNYNFFRIDNYLPQTAEVFSVNAYTYFIRTGASGQPALWRLNNAKAITPSENPVELIEGIENMQIVYGVDSPLDQNKIPNYYLPANQVSNSNNWPNVVSVQISLLAVSLDDNLTSQPVPYTFNNILTTPTDRRIRRVFNTTIALRNRLL